MHHLGWPGHTTSAPFQAATESGHLATKLVCHHLSWLLVDHTQAMVLTVPNSVALLSSDNLIFDAVMLLSKYTLRHCPRSARFCSNVHTLLRLYSSVRACCTEFRPRLTQLNAMCIGLAPILDYKYSQCQSGLTSRHRWTYWKRIQRRLDGRIGYQRKDVSDRRIGCECKDASDGRRR